MRGPAEHVRGCSVERHGASRLPVGPQGQDQAAAKTRFGRRLAESGPTAFGCGVIDSPRLVVAQSLHDRAVATVELGPVQVVQPPVGCREGEAALFRGDRHRGGGTARDQFGPQPG